MKTNNEFEWLTLSHIYKLFSRTLLKGKQKYSCTSFFKPRIISTRVRRHGINCECANVGGCGFHIQVHIQLINHTSMSRTISYFFTTILFMHVDLLYIRKVAADRNHSLQYWDHTPRKCFLYSIGSGPAKRLTRLPVWIMSTSSVEGMLFIDLNIVLLVIYTKIFKMMRGEDVRSYWDLRCVCFSFFFDKK